MPRVHLLAAVLLGAFVSTSASAIVIDGAYDAAYGAAKSNVLYNPTAPDSNSVLRRIRATPRRIRSSCSTKAGSITDS